MVRETRHLWVGNLPENVREEKIIEHFKRYGRVESVKVLPKRGSEGGVAAFVDFVDIKSAQKAHNTINKMGDRDLRTDYNEPGTIPSAARGLDDSLSIATRGRDVSGFTRGAGATVYGPPASLHSREGRYERRLDGASESRERTYDHSAYGHHERGSSSSSFDRQRHYDTEYYRDPRDRTLSGGGSGSASSSSASTGGASLVVTGGSGGTGLSSSAPGGSSASSAITGNVGSTSCAVSFYGSRCRSPGRFETTETRYEARTRESYTLASVVHRDLYREERGRRGDRTYRHSRSRSPHNSQSHNVSPQRLTSPAARPPHSPSGSGSHSRSSSSDSASSSSSSGSGSESSSSSSDESPARSVQSAAVQAPSSQPLPPLDKDEPRKSFGIKVQNLPVRSTDTSLKDGLFHEFKKHGKVTSVQIHGASEERYGLVFFRQQEDQEKALSASKGKLFFGMQIDVTAWTGPETESENEFRPLDERIDEFHPKATRTLFIGNLEKTTSYHDLLNIFQRFGDIVDIDIKKVNGAPQYAFLQYCDIASVCKAIKKMDGEYLGSNRLKLGFGKSMPTTCVWLDGLASNITEQYLTRHFCRYGHVVKVVFDRLKGMALVLYNNIECAQAAVKETKGWKIGGNKIKVDFANHESQMAFYRSMQASGQDIRDFYDILSDRRDDRRPLYHEFSTERACYENVRTPGTYVEELRRKYSARSREFYTEWDPYTTDYCDSRYYDEPCEFRDYRDPYEQDIRKYSYMQRERNRDRERCETDRERDHSRRTAEHNQSPSHPRRPSSPTASPVLTERLVSDSEHHIYSRSSERSGSCSSISPPRFEKPDRIRLERYNKSDKLEKERPLFEADRGNGGEKERRAGRKEKDRTEKHKLRKLKLSSPSVPSSETDLEPDREASPDTAQRNSSKTLTKEKESGKEKLALPPCVVHLTRVKEKEGKFVDHAVVEKQRIKAGSDNVNSPTPPPLADHKTVLHRIEIQSREVFKHGKMPKDKCLASQVEIVDKEGKIKGRKYLKDEPVFEKSNSDADRLAARKRRFEEETTRANQLRRVSQNEDEGRFGLKWLGSIHFSKGLEEDKKFAQLEMPKRESRIDKKECMVTLRTTSERPDSEMSKNLGHNIDLQLRELAEEATDPINDLDQRMHDFGAKDQQCLSLNVSDTKNLEMEQHLIDLKRHSALHQIDALNSDERLLFDLDHSQSCRKQMEQNRQLQQHLQDCDNTDKTESALSTDVQDFDRQSPVHVLGRPPQDVTDVSLPLKRKRSETFDYHFITNKECSYQGSRELNDDSERNITSALDDEDLPADSLHLTHADKAKDKFKPENNSHWVGFKCNNHNTVTDMELFKAKKSLIGNEGLGWESKMKQDTLKEISFPSTIVKRESIRKRLVHELEPGEVRSDSDDDEDDDDDDDDDEYGNYTHMSLKLDTSHKRECEGKVLDLKLSGSLEKNKFYEFALDKTITPDTKALLERAKSLSSSREDNWSFLGYDSRFTSFRNCTDKEKVEPTPRPIPSWYMKKKKIRSNSERKLDDKKEDPKLEEQESGELFASRFLHSSIFEQDSRRLRHLECKDGDPEIGLGKEKAIITVEKTETVGADLVQEPTVLFHNRFLELQQKKDKDQESHSAEKNTDAETVEKNTVPDQEQVQSPKETDVVIGLKSVCPSLTESLLNPTETFVHQNKPTCPVTESSLLPVIDEKFEDTQIVSHQLSSPTNDIKAALAVSTPPFTKMDNTEVEPEEEIYEHRGIAVNILAAEQNVDVKPPTPGACLGNLEAESDSAECLSPIPAKLKDVHVPLKVELAEEKPEYLDCNSHQNVESSLEMQLVVSEPEVEPTQPARKQTKNKKAKANPSSLLPMLPSQPASIEKPAIRKSERIDREKLKRTSSPRGEATKIISDSKSSSKSPVYATDLEQINDPNMPHGRTRQRRNVRSVYATPHEDEAHQQQGKDFAESSRSMRKRADKESVEQDVSTPPASTRRGRPPKTRKRMDVVSSMNGEQTKTPEVDDTNIKESGKCGEMTKIAEGWRSPRSQKVQAIVRAGQSRKPAKTDKPSEADISESLKSQVKAKDDTPSLEKVDKKSETDLMSKPQMSEISVNVKVPRLTRNTKTIPIDKSVNLKNLVIDLSGDAVKDALYSGDESSQHCQDPSKKTKTELSVKEDSTTAKDFKVVDDLSPDEREEVLSDVEPPAEPEEVFLARQMELERAVENISNLSVEQPPPYKEPSCQPPVVLTPVAAESDQTEVEKPANPASETELAAAIDSITTENISADADGFHTPPTYTSLHPTSLVLPTSNEAIEPVTGLVIKSVKDFEPSSSLIPHSKSSQLTVVTECPPSEVPKKGGRPRLKTNPKKSKGRKFSANRKSDVISHAVLEAELAAVKLPESIPEDMQTANPKTATSAAAATVVTVAAACKHDVASVVTLNTPKEAEQPAVDQPEPQESAFHSGTNSPSYLRSPEPLSEPVAPALTPPSTCLNVTPAHSAKVPHTTPDWVTRTDEKVIPPIHKAAVVATAPTVVVGSHSANTAIPPDTKASDIDPSSSTLRKILMEPKYVSALNSSSVPSTLLTTSLTDPRMSQNESLPVIKSSVLKDRPSPVTPITPQMVPPQQPPPQPNETLNIFQEKMGNTVISSTATSVISRIPLPFDFDNTPRISLSNRSSGLSQPKHKYRFGMNDNNRYRGLSNSDEGRSSDSTPSNPGSGPGLRVNTSEGVMVLSYSGQKTEGPQRIVAKISQIPPASVVDIEFQQSVSKSHVKQEQLQPQPSTPKASQTPTAQGHTGAILSTQGFNAQPVISSIKKEGPVSDKSESSSHIGSQGAPLKTFQHISSSHQVLRYNPSILQQHHVKKVSVVESVSAKADIKQSQSFNHSPVLSPHPSPLPGNHISSPATPNDRLVCHQKHELHCPRTLVSPFSKVCPPSTSVGLGVSGPNHVTKVHHPEQSVIMHPHSATQSVTIGQLSQGNVRMNTPPLAGINYGIRTDALSSPTSTPPQRTTTPQPVIMRERLLKQHASAGQVSGANENDVRHFHQGTHRTSLAQLHSDVVVMQPEYKGIHHGGLHLDHYNRDLRALMPQQLTEHPGVLEAHKAQTPEPPSLSSPSHISSASSKSPSVKNPPLTLRDSPKALEVKMSHSPHSENRVIGHNPGSVISAQGVQRIHPGSPGSMPECYREIHGFHSQLPGSSVIGINMANYGIAPSQRSQEGEHRSKPAHIASGGQLRETTLTMLHVRHPGSMDMSHVHRIQDETTSPAYNSPTAITPKLELSHSLQKGLQCLSSGPISLLPSAPSNIRPDIKSDSAGHTSVDMVQLLKKYPIVWQGHLALKNDSAAVQLHFVSGNNVLAHRSLPPSEGGPPLRIAQRMRLEASQLEGVARRMTLEDDYCLLLALPCGLDQDDVLIQTHALKTCFITYLQAKQAAGIINVPNPGSNQPAYVVQIFPPCEFSESHLSHLAPDLLKSISSISPHLMIVIASV
ncbi:msx2-interacting protein [Ictalurus punctatus]|uniref:Msx2-interacting protein n=1 Tax=Ictalurus punctatus TaxID=7998 RepID=A0A2D0SJK5_ICTPU|nr:msx2-interacting protein [Ictalurus punctatus]